LLSFFLAVSLSGEVFGVFLRRVAATQSQAGASERWADAATAGIRRNEGAMKFRRNVGEGGKIAF